MRVRAAAAAVTAPTKTRPCPSLHPSPPDNDNNPQRVRSAWPQGVRCCRVTTKQLHNTLNLNKNRTACATISNFSLSSGDQIYVKTKWKIGSSLQEHKSAELPASSNAVFSPPHQVNLGVLSDNGLKINFAVKASATLIAKTLGTGDATVATIMAADGGRYTVSMGGISVTCSIDAPAELRARAASLTQQRAAASSAPSTATVAAQALFETEDHADMPQKTGLSSLAGQTVNSANSKP
jgi:hypothetical protein